MSHIDHESGRVIPPDEAVDILLVDDELSILHSLARQLTRAGYNVTQAPGGQAGLDALPLRPYSLLIVDYWMASVSGVDVLRAAAQYLPEVPRLAITGSTDPETILDCINSGLAHRVLIKPWDDVVMLQVVQELAGCYQVRKDHERLVAELQSHAQQIQQLQTDLEQAQSAGSAEQSAAFSNETAQDLVALLAYLLDTIGGGRKQSMRVALLSSSLAAAQGLSENEVRQVEVAALLKDIANITDVIHAGSTAGGSGQSETGIPQDLRPLLAGELLRRISGFEEIAEMVRQLQLASTGAKDDQERGELSMGAQILDVAETFDRQMFPMGDLSNARPQAAMNALDNAAGDNLNQELVQLFQQQVLPAYVEESYGITEISLADVQPGMVLKRDVANYKGVPLLAAGTVLTQEIITSLQENEGFSPLFSRIYIRTNSIPVAEGEGNIQTVLMERASTSPIYKPVEIGFPSFPKSSTSPKKEGKRTIVVIDDNPNVVSALKRELESSNYIVKTFINPVEGLNFIRSKAKIHAVLTDYMMPGLLGSRLLQLIGEVRPQLPCIVITAHATQDTISRLVQSGSPVRVFAKPWDKQQLLETLAALEPSA